MAVQRVVGAFLDHLTVERGASEHTVAGYRRDLARYREFLDEWGRADLAEVTEADVAAFATWLRAGSERHPPLAPSSVKAYSFTSSPM